MHLPATRALTILVAFDAGTRTEHADESGVAHFVEHLVFRGCDAYPTARDVNLAVQRLGATMNGYITHDLVAFHVTVRSEQAVAAAELLAAIAGSPTMARRDVETERRVVLEDAGRTAERPDLRADDLLVHALFGDQPLGRPVVGDAATLRLVGRDALLAFRARRYDSGHAVAVLSGNLEAAPLDAVLAALAGLPSLAEPDPVAAAVAGQPQRIVERRASGRAHVRLGFPVPGDPRDAGFRAALKVFSALLGGTPGSRLFDDLRERRGLCYSVFAGDHCGSDYAVLRIAADTATANVRELVDAAREHVDRLRSTPPGEEEVALARTATASRRVLALERSRAVADYAARQALVWREPVDPDDAVRSLDAATVDDVARIARSIPLEPSIACVGEVSDDDLP